MSTKDRTALCILAFLALCAAPLVGCSSNQRGGDTVIDRIEEIEDDLQDLREDVEDLGDDVSKK